MPRPGPAKKEPTHRGSPATAPSKKAATEAERKRSAARFADGLAEFADTAGAWYVHSDSPALTAKEKAALAGTTQEMLEDSHLFDILAPYLLPLLLGMIVIPIAWRLHGVRRTNLRAAADTERWAVTAPHPGETPHAQLPHDPLD